MNYAKKLILLTVLGLSVYETTSANAEVDKKIVIILEKLKNGPELSDTQLNEEILRISSILESGDENCKNAAKKLQGITIKDIRKNSALLLSLAKCSLKSTQNYLNSLGNKLTLAIKLKLM